VEELDAAFADVDAHPEADQLVESMRATAMWPAVRTLRNATRPALEASRSVLDVGCGLADVLIELGQRAHGTVELTGVDTSDRMLSAASADAAAAGVRLELLAASAVDLPFQDGRFDATRSERVLQWLDDPAAAVSEMVRVTRPSGSVVLIDTDWRTVAFDLGDRPAEEALSRFLGSRPGGDAGGRLRRYALEAGLRDVEVHAATAVLERWSPEHEDAPPGFIPIHAITSMMHQIAGVPADEADRIGSVARQAARRDRFQMTVSILAVVGRR
jgi:SAM-dependent methyltransferase